MARDTTRTHVVLPSELVAEIDARVGRRRRSEFIAEVIAERLRRLKLIELTEQLAGSLADADIPGWETDESAAEWVHASRREEELPLPRQRDRA